MRHPNGYGTVTKLSGNRRKPYVARKTKGFDDRGYPIYSIIGYYSTKEEGLIALANYNNNPYDLSKDKTTMSELYELWLEKKSHKLGINNIKSLKSAFNNCKSLHQTKYKTIRAFHMQDCIDNCGLGSSSQAIIKNLFNHLDNFAFEMDIINKRYSELLTTAPAPETSKLPFTDEEVDRLWSVQDMDWVDSVLVLLYSGFRISELLGLKTANVDLSTGTMKGGVKTAAGKNRIVPIHSKIHHIIEYRVNQGNEYIFSLNEKQCSIGKYRKHWETIMKTLNMNHTPHECRHTFRSRLDSVGANKVCIDLIMGHKSGDTGERIYTHKTLEELKIAIELVTN